MDHLKKAIAQLRKYEKPRVSPLDDSLTGRVHDHLLAMDKLVLVNLFLEYVTEQELLEEFADLLEGER